MARCSLFRERSLTSHVRHSGVSSLSVGWTAAYDSLHILRILNNFYSSIAIVYCAYRSMFSATRTSACLCMHVATWQELL